MAFEPPSKAAVIVDEFFFEAIGASDPSPTLDTTREDREWTTEIQGAAQHFRKAARDFQMPHGIFGSNSGFANRARHLPEAAFLLEKPCSILGSSPRL